MSTKENTKSFSNTIRELNSKASKVALALLLVVSFFINFLPLQVTADDGIKAVLSENYEASLVADNDTSVVVKNGASEEKINVLGIESTNGKVWVDQSVICEKDDNGDYSGNFVVTLSAMGQEYIVSSTAANSSSRAADVMLILDITSSMDGTLGETDSTKRIVALVNAANMAIDTIMDANPNNRISITVYGNTNLDSDYMQWLELAHYETDEKYTASDAPDESYIGVGKYLIYRSGSSSSSNDDSDETTRTTKTTTTTSRRTSRTSRTTTTTTRRNGRSSGVSSAASPNSSSNKGSSSSSASSSSSSQRFYISTSQQLTKTQNGTTSPVAVSEVTYNSTGTYTQYGTYVGFQYLISQINNSTYDVPRDPYVLILTDGAANYASPDWNTTLTNNSDYSLSARQSESSELAAVTALTAAMQKQNLIAAYRNYNSDNSVDATVFTIGLSDDVNGEFLYMLDPASSLGSAGKDFREVIDSYAAGTAYSTSGSAWIYPTAKDDNSGYYTYSVTSMNDLNAAFRDLAELVRQNTLSAISPVEYVGVSGGAAVEFVSELGEGMELKSAPVIIYSNAEYTHTDKNEDGDTVTYTFGNLGGMQIIITTDSETGNRVVNWGVPANYLPLVRLDIDDDGNVSYNTSANPIRAKLNVGIEEDSLAGIRGTYYSNAYDPETMLAKSYASFVPKAANPYYFNVRSIEFVTDTSKLSRSADSYYAGTAVGDVQPGNEYKDIYVTSEMSEADKASFPLTAIGTVLPEYTVPEDASEYLLEALSLTICDCVPLSEAGESVGYNVALAASETNPLVKFNESATQSEESLSHGSKTPNRTETANYYYSSAMQTYSLNSLRGSTTSAVVTTMLGNNGEISFRNTNILLLDKTVNDSQANQSESMTYTIEVINQGDKEMTDVSVVDALPEGLSFKSASDSGAYSEATNSVTWNIDTLAAGESKTVSLVAYVSNDAPDGILTNRADASVMLDGEEYTAFDSEDITVTNIRGLTVTKRWKNDIYRNITRPDSVTVVISAKANGESVDIEGVTDTPIVLSESNESGASWSETLTELPKYIDGEEITYFVSEYAVKNYTAEYSGDVASDNAKKVVFDENDYASVVITNTYEQPESAQITLGGSKTLTENGEAKAIEENQFTFSLEEHTSNNSDEYTMPEELTAFVKADGSFEFGEIEFAKAGTYRFVITEDDLGAEGYEYDSTIIIAEVTVELIAENNELSASVTYLADDESVENIVFENTYSAPTTTTTEPTTTTTTTQPTTTTTTTQSTTTTTTTEPTTTTTTTEPTTTTTTTQSTTTTTTTEPTTTTTTTKPTTTTTTTQPTTTTTTTQSTTTTTTTEPTTTTTTTEPTTTTTTTQSTTTTTTTQSTTTTTTTQPTATTTTTQPTTTTTTTEPTTTTTTTQSTTTTTTTEPTTTTTTTQSTTTTTTTEPTTTTTTTQSTTTTKRTTTTTKQRSEGNKTPDTGDSMSSVQLWIAVSLLAASVITIAALIVIERKKIKNN